MKKNNYLNKIIIIAFFIIIFLGLRDAVIDFEYEKITQASKLPTTIQNALAEYDLQRGVYFFSNTFTKGDTYVVICAGEEYITGYDVNINSHKYYSVVEDSEKKPIYGYYELDITEKDSSTTYEYCDDSQYPFVVFKLSGKAKRYWIKINSKKTLNVNRWWGDDKRLFQSKKWSCEVIYSKDQLPQFIDDDFSMKWGDVKGFCKPSGLNNKKTSYIIIAGKKGEPPFNVTIDAIDWRKEIVTPATSISQKTFDIIVRKEYNKEFVFEHKSVPYNLIQVKHDESLDALWLKNIIFLDDSLNWEKSKN
ncbi:hypothetical protein IMX26_08695 [Clostridium sp. 'deep sea']|uniref:hypothetical protein n=1 Tax=Clostridium sp. 'deep sea' TaxID=2779445 RepID=UPI0018967831|nr:hypothetical protein [Clostridium sp. 'deep sea']QOR36869.1 hypothetical protein IMX26_08695 [Clostridium sp. 'deep sea']